MITLQNRGYVKWGKRQSQAMRNAFFSHPQKANSYPFMDAFDGFVQPLAHLVQSLGEKNQNLQHTRDMLLPKLISGDLDVSELDIEIKDEAA